MSLWLVLAAAAAVKLTRRDNRREPGRVSPPPAADEIKQ